MIDIKERGEQCEGRRRTIALQTRAAEGVLTGKLDRIVVEVETDATRALLG